jgi:hypothetical protein
MSTDFHDALAIDDAVTIAQINARLSDLDAAITTQAAASVGMSAALLYDSKTTGTNGGSASATTWNTRTLNSEVDPDSIVALSDPNFTPTAGTYVIQAIAPAYRTEENRLRLYNVTQTSVVFAGLNAFSDAGDTVQVMAALYWIFTANGTDAYRIDHYTDTASGSIGLGLNVGDGGAEVYTQVLLLKFG